MRLCSPVQRALEQLPENLVMNRDQLEQALAFGNGASSEFVRTPQYSFASTHRIVTERRGIFSFEFQVFLTFPSEFWFHRRIPVMRKASTRASSLWLQKVFMILSAALCGFSRAERVLVKSVRMPSVAKTSKSPCDTGSTAACSCGR